MVMNWDKVKKAIGIKPKVKEKQPTSEETRRAALDQEKQEATKKGEPWVAVLDLSLIHI